MNSTPGKRIMVDMSATLIHHGHIRIIKSAAAYGEVIIGLTSDEGILAAKHYLPELDFQARAEILMAIQYVKDVVETPWHITEQLLDEHHIDLLVHGDDNQNQIAAHRLIILPRTQGISSSVLREKAAGIFTAKALVRP